MRRLFIQFYLILISCFLLAVVMIAVVYRQAVDDVGERYLSDLLHTTLSLIETDLQGVPEARWNEILDSTSHNLTFRVKLDKLSSYVLDPESKTALERGEIVMLEEQYLFLQQIADSHYMLVAGPLNYLFLLHQLKWFDYALLGLIGLSLGIPVFIWMRPHWRNLMALEQAASKLAAGDLTARVVLPSRSGVKLLEASFNHMANNITALLNSKKALINAVAHELRTPLARLRYRLALLDGQQNTPDRQAIERDLLSIDQLVEELLLHAQLDYLATPLVQTAFDPLSWCQDRVAEQATLASQLCWRVDEHMPSLITADYRLITRALDNLLSNARRHARSQVKVTISSKEGYTEIWVEDDGEGVPEADCARVFDPFVRLDKSRGRETGGSGLGLAIVASIVRAHQGQVRVESSSLGGARFVMRWAGNPLHSTICVNM